MILGYTDLRICWKRKIVKFEPDIEESQIGICSIDLRLGYNFSRIQDNPGITITPRITKSLGLFNEETKKPDEIITIHEREFMTGMTLEKISLPNNIAALVEGRSTYARWGLSAHVTAPLIQPGWYGPITLELYNHSNYNIELQPGKERICQIMLFKTTSPIPKKIIDALSRYRGQTSPIPKPFNEKPYAK